MRAVDKTTFAFVSSYLGDIIYSKLYNYTTINNENAYPASPHIPLRDDQAYHRIRVLLLCSS